MKDLIKSLLRESLFDKNSMEQVDLLEDFIKFISKELKVKSVPVKLKWDRTGLVTTASYQNKTVNVYAKERALVDIMRSIAHEYTHMQQDVNGSLKDSAKDGATGSQIENEANYKAGQLIRKFGDLHPEIYD